VHAPRQTPTFSPRTRRDVWLRRTRRLATVALAAVGLVGLAWAERVPLLRESADLWIVSDPLTPADVAVVLGGGLEVRPFAAAEFYRKGIVKKVLVSRVAAERGADIGAIPEHTESNRRILLKLGVPADAIETFGTSNKSTKDEAVALRQWAQSHAVRAVIIPTEIFGARRVRWIFQREFAGEAIRINVPSFDPPQYARADWWTVERGIVEFQNEILKYIYYRLKY
jgi:uncharacterized SAM-binding protein YcdF (DUF218 family)